MSNGEALSQPQPPNGSLTTDPTLLAGDADPSRFIRAHTFSEARQQPTTDRVLTTDVIQGLLRDEHVDVSGNPVLAFKTRCDRVPIGASEVVTARNPDMLADLHDQIADMIVRNCRIVFRSNDPARIQELAGAKQGYLQSLEREKHTYRHEIGTLFATGAYDKGRQGSELYGGLKVKDTKGTVVDLADMGQQSQDARPNIRTQREMTGTFVHWETSKRMAAKLKGADTPTTHRIYLNPTTEHLAGIFEEIMVSLDAADIEAKGKMLDRSTELLGKKR